MVPSASTNLEIVKVESICAMAIQAELIARARPGHTLFDISIFP